MTKYCELGGSYVVRERFLNRKWKSLQKQLLD